MYLRINEIFLEDFIMSLLFILFSIFEYLFGILTLEHHALDFLSLVILSTSAKDCSRIDCCYLKVKVLKK